MTARHYQFGGQPVVIPTEPTHLPPTPRAWRIPDHPVDLDAVEAIVQLGRAGTFGPAELRMRLRQGHRMNIPDKAIEAAVRAAFFEDCGSTQVELTDDERIVWDDHCKVILEAAAPFIAAQALRDFADAHRIPFYLFVGDRERVSVNDMIRLCAAELDPQ